MHSTKVRFAIHLCYRYKSEYLACSALTSSSILILLSSLMEKITGTLSQDTNLSDIFIKLSETLVAGAYEPGGQRRHVPPIKFFEVSFL